MANRAAAAAAARDVTCQGAALRGRASKAEPAARTALPGRKGGESERLTPALRMFPSLGCPDLCRKKKTPQTQRSPFSALEIFLHQ
ncbi:hypothetical protein E2320_006266 [Naja naja]|nr:hypothetical protein E2320_006266 [Naja naja]